MFYISEIYYRFFYFLFSVIISISILYFYKDDIIFITIIPILLKNNLFDYFIFTEPREILFLYLYSCLNFLIIVLVPYMLISSFDFIRTATYYQEWLKIKKLKYTLLYIYIIINLTTFFIGLPIFWDFFSTFQTTSNLFSFFLELSAINYFYYFNSIFFITNVFQLFLVIGLVFYVKKGFLFLLVNKSYIFLLFLLFSTLITPPDLILQIILFCSLYTCLEIYIYIFFLFYFYNNKSNY